IVLAHDVEIDDEARLGVAALVAANAEKFADTVGHGCPPNAASGAAGRPMVNADHAVKATGAMEARRRSRRQIEQCCRRLVVVTSRSTPGNDEQASSVTGPAGGEPVETKKARSVVALSRVSR